MNQVVLDEVNALASLAGLIQIERGNPDTLSAGRGHEIDVLRNRAFLVRRKVRSGKPVERIHKFRDFDLVAFAVIPDQIAELVECQQQYADHFRRRRHLARPDQIERALRLVRQFPNLHQVEEAGAPFDRVRGPENPVYQLLIDRHSAALDGQQVGFDRRQVFVRFRQVLFDQLIVEIALCHGSSRQAPATLMC